MDVDPIKVEAMRFAAELARNGALCGGTPIVSQMIEAAGQFEKFLRGETDNPTSTPSQTTTSTVNLQ